MRPSNKKKKDQMLILKIEDGKILKVISSGTQNLSRKIFKKSDPVATGQSETSDVLVLSSQLEF